jgi:aspartyl-tRNA(Asn)/glutamyl-tRNA(Gln) amidotransferase subunit C
MRTGMALTRNQVLHVAGLARLSLTPDEVDRLTHELADILQHVDQLNEVNTRDVPPTDYLAVEALPLREDAVRTGLEQEQALSPAPQVLNDGFRVPAFVED